jgi:hypothetical protein
MEDFYERRNLSGLMSYADGGTGDTSSSRRCPPCGSTLAIWCLEQLALAFIIDSSPHGFARTVFGQQKHAKKIPMGSFLASRQRSKRADMGWGLDFFISCSK